MREERGHYSEEGGRVLQGEGTRPTLGATVCLAQGRRICRTAYLAHLLTTQGVWVRGFLSSVVCEQCKRLRSWGRWWIPRSAYGLGALGPGLSASFASAAAARQRLDALYLFAGLFIEGCVGEVDVAVQARRSGTRAGGPALQWMGAPEVR
jgi:hypothetical protein